MLGSMLRKLCTNPPDPFTSQEIASIEKLCKCHQGLLLSGDVAGVKSEEGYAACTMFLINVDKVSRALNLEIASRTYRTNFSANYRALFPDVARHYRVDVLEASVDRNIAIWVNGEKYELSAEAILYAEALQQAWCDVVAMLERWQTTSVPTAPNVSMRPNRGELSASLVAFDIAWAQFECIYINELIAIEGQARQHIMRAAVYANEMLHLPKDGEQYAEAERHLVRCVAHLNSVANFRRKGRDDLGYDILESAKKVLKRCELECDDATRVFREAAQVLAFDVMAAYDAMRNYLCEVGHCIERVDPHLCNNAGLVARLVDWEASWEVGARYVRDDSMLDAVCDLVAEVKTAQRLVPALTTMCEDCDVELFLILPRLVLICYLFDPTKQRAQIVKTLLPHRFVKCGGGALPMNFDPEFKGLSDCFKEALEVLRKTWPVQPNNASSTDAARELLVKRAVLGVVEATDIYGRCPLATQKAVEDLMREVERWSLELQRHCPEDWNQFSAVVVQCLTGGLQTKPASKFQF